MQSPIRGSSVRPVLRDKHRRKLISRGISREIVERFERDLQEHIDAAVEEMVEDGLSKEEAERRARAVFETDDFLDEFILVTRLRNGFWSRHPFLTFGVVPFLIFAVLPPALIGFVHETVVPSASSFLSAKAVGEVVMAAYCFIKYAVPLLTVGVFCLLVRRLKCDPSVMAWVVLTATAIHLFTYIEFACCPSPHISFGLLTPSPLVLEMMSPSLLVYILIPSTVGFGFALWNGFRVRALSKPVAA